ncbi:T9SS type A sorting domain-containing protein [Algibacter sp. AS12]|uniref:T9SS type A sorting domain-containing protein n=1 Tax=Algibacter sp. AS12 TaxID=3135773 RepID=UPI00398AAB8C
MKIKYILTSLLIIFSLKFYSQSWQNEVDFTINHGDVFPSNWTSTYNNTIDFAFSVSNEPIVAYSRESDMQLIVLKFDGTSWNMVGDLSFLSLSVGQVEIEVTSDDNIFIAFTDVDFQNLNIIKFDGLSWSYVAQNIADDKARELELDKDSNDNIYIAYKDSFNGDKATVKKCDFINNNIITVGVEGFTATDIYHLKLDINPLTKEPYIIYSNNQKAYVYKFDGMLWNQVGNDIFYENFDSGGGQIIGSVGKIDISFSSNGELLACTTEYLNGAGFSQSYAYIFENDNWTPTAIASSDAPMLNSESDNNGNIYFAISNRLADDPYGIIFIKYSNGTFETLEMVDNGSHFASYFEMNFDNNNIPYIIYNPVIISNSHIKKFSTNLDLNEFNQNNLSVFPNPTLDFITVTSLVQRSNFKLYDILGKMILTGIVSENEKIDLSILNKGMYFLKIEEFTPLKITKK